jgi:NAD(P)-dependent dehydrogenase (short-subunit alcohol dehydrogenase family)
MNDRTALVTGANKGIGKHIARLLAAEGFRVHVGSRDAGRGRRAAEEIGGAARVLVLDVTDPDSIAAAAGRVDRLDVLVNNAGIAPTSAPPAETGTDDFRRTYETNVFGVAAVTNAFLPALRRSPRPRIVNVSSGTGSLTWSTNPNPQFTPGSGAAAAYRSSKAALNVLTRACGPPTSTPVRPRRTGIRPRPPRGPYGWRSCRTTGRPARSSPGTERPCRGDVGNRSRRRWR